MAENARARCPDRWSGRKAQPRSRQGAPLGDPLSKPPQEASSPPPPSARRTEAYLARSRRAQGASGHPWHPTPSLHPPTVLGRAVEARLRHRCAHLSLVWRTSQAHRSDHRRTDRSQGPFPLASTHQAAASRSGSCPARAGLRLVSTPTRYPPRAPTPAASSGTVHIHRPDHPPNRARGPGPTRLAAPSHLLRHADRPPYRLPRAPSPRPRTGMGRLDRLSAAAWRSGATPRRRPRSPTTSCTWPRR